MGYASAPWATEEESPGKKYVFPHISVSIAVGVKGSKSSYSERDKMIVHNSSQLKINVWQTAPNRLIKDEIFIAIYNYRF